MKALYFSFFYVPVSSAVLAFLVFNVKIILILRGWDGVIWRDRERGRKREKGKERERKRERKRKRKRDSERERNVERQKKTTEYENGGNMLRDMAPMIQPMKCTFKLLDFVNTCMMML